MNLPPTALSPQKWFTLRQAFGLAALPLLVPLLLLPLYALEAGATVVQTGVCVTAFPVAMLLMRRPVESWARRWGRNACFLAGLGAHVLVLGMLAFARDILWLVVSYALHGAAWAFVWQAASTLAGGQEEGRVQLAKSQTRGVLIGVLLAFALATGGLSLRGPVGADGNRLPGAWMLLFGGYALVGLSALVRAWRSLAASEPGVDGSLETLDDDTPEPAAGRGRALQRFAFLVSTAAWRLTTLVMVVYLHEKLALGVDVLLWVFLPAALVDAFAWPSSPLVVRLGRLAGRLEPKMLLIVSLGVAAVIALLLATTTEVVGLAALWGVQTVCLRLVPYHWPGDTADEPASQWGAVLGPLGGALLYQLWGAALPFYANAVLLGLSAAVLAWPGRAK